MNAATAQPSFLTRLGSFIRFSHTVFALPFALIAMFVAARGLPKVAVFGWIIVCAVAARTLAMCFNRLMDWEIDKLNPRTEGRHRLISKTQAWKVLIISSALAVWASHQLNFLCFALSPLMVIILCFYSLTKRFTPFSHLFLGLALSVAPMGAWAAVRATLLEFEPYILATSVLLWTFGFDLIYSTLDTEFDRAHGLFSFPARFGIPAALRTAKVLHCAAALGFLSFGWVAQLGAGYAVGCALTLVGLFWEHRLASTLEPARINQAFFQINALVSLTLLGGTLFDIARRL
jgi:4-hydroxybenzoate polyprenyltransferase